MPTGLSLRTVITLIKVTASDPQRSLCTQEELLFSAVEGHQLFSTDGSCCSTLVSRAFLCGEQLARAES